MDGSAPGRLLAAAGLTLALAWILGGLSRRSGGPSAAGEIAAGVLLGPSALGRLAPQLEAALFPAAGPGADLRHAVEALAAVLYLLAAGLRVDLGTLARVGPKATALSASGMLISFLAGFLPAIAAPRALGWSGLGTPAPFALFMGSALLISALPAISRTLIDLELVASDMGMVVMAAAVTQDLVGWSLFGALLGLAGASSPGDAAWRLAVPAALALATATVGAKLLDRAFARTESWLAIPGGALGVVVPVALVAAAAAEKLGGAGILGGFFVGVAVGSARRAPDRVRASVDRLVGNVLGPLLFAGVGLSLDAVARFDATLLATLVGLTTLGKVGGGFFGARLAGLQRREALAVGVATNTRGGVEVVLGSQALHAGLIDERVLTALVGCALLTMGVSAPLTAAILGGRRRASRFAEHLDAPAFVPHLAARGPEEAIRELADVLAGVAGLPAVLVAEAVLQRERAMPTGIPGEIAIPHASFPGLTGPLVAVGLAPEGIDFHAPDGLPARIVVLVLTSPLDPAGQTGLLAAIGGTLHRRQMREALPRIREFGEFAALVRSAESAGE